MIRPLAACRTGVSSRLGLHTIGRLILPALINPTVRVQRRYHGSQKISDPLRILFCGSDAFSCASLQALYDEHRRNSDLIRSIDVVVRPGKPTGRGMKKIRQVPLKTLAQELSLPLHERDTFTGWSPPSSLGINLIIAVSFGLFVPPRLLRTAKYGGLNIHPSLLPEFRGPAPLHHTLLVGRDYTGVSLQTLDHANFDHGLVLAQTGRIPIPGDQFTVPQLLEKVTPTAAELLIQGLRDGIHIPPLQDVGWRPSEEETRSLLHAPKIRSIDQQIRWSDWDGYEVEKRNRVLGPLWSHILIPDSEGGLPKRKRIIFDGIEYCHDQSDTIDETEMHAASSSSRSPSSSHGRLIFEEEVEDVHKDQQAILGQDGGGGGGSSSNNRWVTQRVLSTFAKDEGVFLRLGETGVVRIATVKLEGKKAVPAMEALRSIWIATEKDLVGAGC